ncbi:MAG: hypothetical protein EOO01_25505, partial [Chitinophagaceae bacterium]
MLKRQLILLFASLVMITGFFLLPENKSWAEKLFSYGKEFDKQRKRTSLEERMTMRFGNDYTYSVSI